MIPPLKAGVTLDFTTAVPDYPASAGWALTFYLARAATPLITLAAAADGDDYRVQRDAVQTGAWTPGTYSWEARISNGAGVVHEVGSGLVEIRLDIATQAAGADLRSAAQVAYDQALAARASFIATRGRVRRYQVGARSMEFGTTEEIDAEIAFWARRVDAERAIAAGRATGPLGRASYGVLRG